MHPTIFREFERIVTTRGAGARSVLEIGAMASDDTLLALPSLRSVPSRIGVNLDGPKEYKGSTIVKGNANELPFDAEQFDIVLCNSVLEHDPFFWKTIQESKRVLKQGGLFVVGVPGYGLFPGELAFKRVVRRISHRVLRDAGRAAVLLDPILSPTVTFGVHYGPGDYYRFSKQAVEEVLLSHMTDAEVCTLMFPPRVIGAAKKPNGSA